MWRVLPIFILLAACNGTNIPNDPTALPLAGKATSVDASKNAPIGPVPPNTESTPPSMAEDEDKAVVTNPAVVTGTFLHCQYLGDVTATQADLGCNFQTEDGKNTVVEPSQVDIALGATAQPGSTYTLIKAASVTETYVAQVQVRTEDGKMDSALGDLRLNVKDLSGAGRVVDKSYTLGEVAPPPTRPTTTSKNLPILIPVTCGAAGDLCYADTEALAAKSATTPSGKKIELVKTAMNFMVWKEVDGNRVLKSDGSDAWAKKLNTSGRGFSTVDYISYTNIAGRTCPPNVYIDENNKFAKNLCLYYSKEGSGRLNDFGTDGTNGLGAWTTARWYAGNVSACALKGMRLPTGYEAMDSVGFNTDAYPYSNGSPVFAGGQAIPTTGSTWTATTYTQDSAQYMIWNPGNVARYDDFASFICVLP